MQVMVLVLIRRDGHVQPPHASHTPETRQKHAHQFINRPILTSSKTTTTWSWACSKACEKVMVAALSFAHESLTDDGGAHAFSDGPSRDFFVVVKAG
jgi:hypothetical protein